MIIGMGMLFEGGPHSMFEIGEFLAGTKFKKKTFVGLVFDYTN